MRVAIFTDTYSPQVNGVAKTLKRLSSHMEKRGIEHKVFVPQCDGSLSYPNIQQFSSIPFLFYPECRVALANPKRVMDQVRDFSPDIIHVATPLTMGLSGLYAAKKLSIPVVASYHTHFDQYFDYYHLSWASPFLWKYFKWFHSSAEKIFVPSMETKEYLEKRGFRHLSIWKRGVDCAFFHPRKKHSSFREKFGIKEKYLLLYVGRLSPEKDLETLTAIITQLPKELQMRVHWMVIGDGPSYSEIHAQLEHKPNVTMTGFMEGEMLAEAYASADLFVFPSPTETFGNVVLESMASGTPPIVADSGGVKELVNHHVNGLISTVGNADAFIRNITLLIEDDEKLTTLSNAARAYALEQSWDDILDGLILEYENAAVSEEYYLYG